MQLAANWPDESSASLVSPLINGESPNVESRVTLSKQAKAVQLQRLSEETFQFGWVNKRSDSPNPRQIVKAIQLWKENKVWKEISNEVGVPERTLRRYLKRLGYKRDYSYVSKKLSEYKKTEEHKNNISKARIVKGTSKGKNNPNWKGGIRNPKVQVWNTIEYKAWRDLIFKRDNYTCRGCGAKNGGGKTIRLEAHHILPRRDFPHLIFDLLNGITLCKKCHDKTRLKEYLSVNIWKQRVS